MNRKNLSARALLLATLLGAVPGQARTDDAQILATVGDRTVTAAELEKAIASSPFTVQFNTLDQDQQAALRGSLLQRLVASRLLYLEAQRLGLESDEAFRTEMEGFRQGMLYHRYMNRLRAGIEVPSEVKARMDAQFAGNTEARKAAESAYRADRFKTVQMEDLKRLRAHYHVRVNEAAISPEAAPETVFLQGDGLRITHADLMDGTEGRPDNTEWLRDRLYRRAQFLLVSQAAVDAGIDPQPALAGFRAERLPALLLERKGREWVPDGQVLKDYFQAHPDLGRIMERRHIGQLVVASREEAETLRERILAGESLFELAGHYSIDPYGRAHKGDMGWVKVGQGMPAVEQAIDGLADGEVSTVIESPMGYHLITILERRPGEQRSFDQVRDKVRQAYLEERIAAYIQELAQRFPVQWQVLDHEVSRN